MPLRSPTVSNDKLSALNYNHHASILPLCTGLARRITTFLNDDSETPVLRAVQEKTKVALGVIDSALDRYSVDEISLAYHGSQECLVLLNLLLCALARLETPLPPALQTVYVASPEAFAQVDAFVNESVAAYRLDLTRYALPKKDAFKLYLEEHNTVKAILMGITRSDPQSQTLTHFDETDQGWPAFTRVHPIIDWDHDEIWAFIRYFQIPYSSFYGQNMSPGGIRDMFPKPTLMAASDDHDHEYGQHLY